MGISNNDILHPHPFHNTKMAIKRIVTKHLNKIIVPRILDIITNDEINELNDIETKLDQIEDAKRKFIVDQEIIVSQILERVIK